MQLLPAVNNGVSIYSLMQWLYSIKQNVGKTSQRIVARAEKSHFKERIMLLRQELTISRVVYEGLLCTHTFIRNKTRFHLFSLIQEDDFFQG